MDTNPFESPQAAAPTESEAPRPPLRFGEIFRRSFSVLQDAPVIFGVILVVQLAVGLAGRLVQDPANPIAFGAPQGILTVLGYLTLAWATGVSVHVAEGRPVKETLLRPLLRAPLTLVAIVLYFIIIMAGMFFLILPGIYLAVLFGFSLNAIASGRAGYEAFGISSKMVRGRWWSVFGLFCFSVLPALLFAGAQYALAGFDPVAMAQLPWPVAAFGNVIFLWQLSYWASVFLAAEVETEPASSA